jgi:chromosomal replication initiator protein
LELPVHLELTPAWSDFRAELRRAVGETTYDLWLAPLEPRAWDGALLLLDAPPATQAWLADRFGSLLERCARVAFGVAVRVAFTAAPAKPGRGRALAATGAAAATTPAATPPAAADHFIPRCTFDQFIIGDGNRLAHGAALAVAEAPGQTYNPLFLCASPGLGKTHLLHAIANYITEFDPETTVRYTTAEHFTNGFLSALHSRSVEDFKHLYRDVDVLLIDDVQFLASKAKTEEEFFHTFNALHDSGRQLVLTCDRVPRQLDGVAERLRDRFESGLIAELSPPDRSTRIAILRKRAELDRIAIPDPLVYELLADRITDNVRSLEGGLIRVVAHHSLTSKPLDATLTERVLDQIRPVSQPVSAAPGTAPSPMTTARIQAEVAAHFGITVEDLVSPTRAARVAWPRQIAVHLTRELTPASLQTIGAAFGGRNHATVVHACRRVAERAGVSPDDAADIASIFARLTAVTDDRVC